MNSFIGNGVDTFANNIWFAPRPLAYRYEGIWHIGQLGNYWDAYTGNDTNRDHVGDTPYGGDSAPLMDDPHKYYIGDYDNDGLWDLHEATIYNTDPLKTDTDGDMLPDGWEIKYGLNATNHEDASQDKDNDGLTNLEEYQRGTDPTQPDTDSDGLPDGWEVTYGLNPLQDDASQDIDGDGLTNLEEYQHSTNPIVADTDADGMPDGWEVTYGLNPTNSSDASLDEDGDRLSNVREFWFGTDPTDPDSDGDGYEDGFEVLRGSDPLDPSDHPISPQQNITSLQNVSVPSIPTIYWFSLVTLSIATIASLGALIIVIRRKPSP